MKRGKLIKNCVLYDTQSYNNYEDYKEYCKCIAKEPLSEYSQDFYDFVSQERDLDWEFFESNMNHSNINDSSCMLMGTLGLWNKKPDIIPIKFETIMDAIYDCLNESSYYDFDIVLNEGHIDVNVHHHDGTNHFEIYLLSKKGITESERPIYKWEKDFEPKPYWFKKIWGYLF